MRYGGDNRGRLLLIVLIVTSLFLITLDLRGVQVIDGIRTGTHTALTPVQKAGSWVVSPFRNFLSDVTHLGRTRNQIEKLKAENDALRLALLNRKVADAELKQLKGALDLAGKGGFKVVSAKVISICQRHQGSRVCALKVILASKPVWAIWNLAPCFTGKLATINRRILFRL